MFSELTIRMFFAAVTVLFGLSVDATGEQAASQPELTEALEQAELFASLTREEKESLRSAARVRHCHAGLRIIEQGHALDSMFIVLDGPAEVRVDGESVATLSAQSLVGEVEFLDGLPGSADVVVLDDTRVIELNNATLSNLMSKKPRLGYVLMGEIAKIEARRLRLMDQHLAPPRN
jgi:CRP/FNR family cyclic AMP-dependent transcriptional regulator